MLVVLKGNVTTEYMKPGEMIDICPNWLYQPRVPSPLQQLQMCSQNGSSLPMGSCVGTSFSVETYSLVPG